MRWWGETGRALQVIVDTIGDVSSHVSEIASSAHEQSASIAEINAAVMNLDQVTQQNAAMFEETTAASHALTREATDMHSAMARFATGHDDDVNIPPVAQSPEETAWLANDAIGEARAAEDDAKEPAQMTAPEMVGEASSGLASSEGAQKADLQGGGSCLSDMEERPARAVGQDFDLDDPAPDQTDEGEARPSLGAGWEEF
ncbi:MAG: methyl-accepting chemotaxis protein [Pseudomonadota bacterium]